MKCVTVLSGIGSDRLVLRHWIVALGLLSLPWIGLGCTPPAPTIQDPASATTAATAVSGASADQLLVVDCLLPGRVRKLGRRLTYLTPRQAVKTSALDCEIRGGEYVAYDRSDYATALKVWLPQAQGGDPQAQTYVGEIYEKGLGIAPDYVVAASWYRKAAEQGDSRAQINLGQLYEKGLGVARDSATALNWYRRASGLNDAVVLDTSDFKWDTPGGKETAEELQELRQEVERWKSEAASLRQQLEQAQEQLDRGRQELQQRQSNVEAAQQQLALARQEFEAHKRQATANDNADLQRLATQLQQRETELARRQQELGQLQQQVASLKDEAERHRTQLTQLEQQRQQVALAGPSIEMIDPALVGSGTRGLAVVNVSPEIVGQKREIVGKITAPAGLLTLNVNDQQTPFDAHGLFRTTVPVRGDRVPVKVVAVDQQGKRASVEFQLTPEPVSTASRQSTTPAFEFGPYYALIIGNTNYQYWPKLKTPENDAKAMVALLSQKYGFKTRVLFDATRFDILQALNELRKTLTEQDNLLIYYAGHGHFDTQIQRGYWVPVDGETDSNANWISTFAITDALSAMSVKHVLVVADSCYSGALTRSALARLEAGMSKEAREHWIRAMVAKRSRTLLASGGLQPVLDSGGGDHSVFAKALLDVLQANHEALAGQRLGLEVSARVSYAAAAELLEQEPQYAPIRFAGHEAGDFFFVPTSALQSRAPSSQPTLTRIGRLAAP